MTSFLDLAKLPEPVWLFGPSAMIAI